MTAIIINIIIFMTAIIIILTTAHPNSEISASGRTALSSLIPSQRQLTACMHGHSHEHPAVK